MQGTAAADCQEGVRHERAGAHAAALLALVWLANLIEMDVAGAGDFAGGPVALSRTCRR